MDIERRGVGEPVKVEVRAEGDAPMVSGYAALFNEETVIAGFFREKIAPGAFAGAVKSDDVRALFNHDPNYVLGRTKNNTLTLKEDGRGLFYDVTLNPDDPDAMSVRAKIQRGDVSGSSFGFTVEEEKWQEPAKNSRELPLRTILKASLFDVSPVTYPAYPTTTVSARSTAESIAEVMKTAAAATAAADAKALATAEAAVDALKSADAKDLDAMRASLDSAKAWRT